MRSFQRKRSGTIVVLTAMMMVFLFALMAFALDVGYIHVVRTELNRSADAAALAAAGRLLEEQSAAALSGRNSLPLEVVRSTADTFCQANSVAQGSPTLSPDEVTIGRLASSAAEMDFRTESKFNAVRVRVRKSAGQNGEIPLFFARIFGSSSIPTSASATAMFISNFSGFKAPTSGENLDILPITLKIDYWNSLPNGRDDWKWNAELKRVESGPDGIKEVNLYPRENDSSGNCGTIDIGSSNNSTADISRQILHGITAADLAHLGGKIEFDAKGELSLNGDTGISAGIKDELAAIRGKPRMIPIYSRVAGPGNNAQYTVIRFVGIRILDSDLTGSKKSKYVTVQPARVMPRGGIPNTGNTQTSEMIFSPVWLAK